MKTTFYGILFAAALTGCATPTVVTERTAADLNLTCDELLSEISEAERFENEARGDRGVTGTNVAAAVVFWPALLGTYANTEEAIKAARGRQTYLSGLYEDKSCSDVVAADSSATAQSVTERLRELDSMKESGLITEAEYLSARQRALGL